MISATNCTAYNFPYFVTGKNTVFCFLNQSKASFTVMSKVFNSFKGQDIFRFQKDDRIMYLVLPTSH